jgi:hypothetical protein
VTAIFSPYHNFTKARSFKRAFSDLNRHGGVTPSAQVLPRYCDSCTTKLRSTEHHLNILLSFKTVLISHPDTIATTVTTGSGNPSATGVSPVSYDDVSRELDGFFTSLWSVFDIFAHEVNLVYLTPPLTGRDVSFKGVLDAMSRIFSSERLTLYMSSLVSELWYKDLDDFRRCITHRNEVDIKIITSRTLFAPALETKILLPDDPLSYPSTYSLNRECGSFGSGIFKKALNAIDHMYELMETKIRNVGHVPI